MKKQQIGKVYAPVFLLGGALYCTIELLFRGWTHPTMGVAGGLCFTGMYAINKYLGEKKLLRKCIASCLLITEIEFLAGCLLNLWLKMRIWDYSQNRFDLFGQICLKFCVLWFLLSIPGVALCEFLRRKLEKR